MRTFQKILVANRGEIAVRVMQTAQKLGYQTVAVYSDIDQASLHVVTADQAVNIGAPIAADSYLSIDKIINAAQSCGADAIHPGYGFLSENAEFAQRCAQEGITFIGPSPQAINLMGSKRLSKLAMLESDVPCVPGYQGSDQSDRVLIDQASEIGFPIMIKASAGGGGRGMRLVHDAADLPQELSAARAESLAAFASDELILERAILEPRHIEIQVFADKHGNVVYLGERDCSIQRRHQKVVEEAPSPFVDEALRKKMGQAAVSAAKACDYLGAGTVEFLVDSEKNFYFLEMNTRLQVEHPVTEMITGLDLVHWQLLVADGGVLPLIQDQITYQGHAIEVRLYAEDPRDNFMPQTGTVLDWSTPNLLGIRVDSGIQKGQVISPYYDPMLAKVISYKETREQAVSALSGALKRTVLMGLNHNVAFLDSVLLNDTFKRGEATTAFIEQEFSGDDYQVNEPSSRVVALAAILFYRLTQMKPAYQEMTWTSAAPLTCQYGISRDGSEYRVELSAADQQYQVNVLGEAHTIRAINSSKPSVNRSSGIEFEEDGVSSKLHYTFGKQALFMQLDGEHFEFQDSTYRPAQAVHNEGDGSVRAAMDGAIVEIAVNVGDKVKQGQVLIVLEAMKMAHQLKANMSGIITDIGCVEGMQVKTRQVLASIIDEGL